MIVAMRLAADAVGRGYDHLRPVVAGDVAKDAHPRPQPRPEDEQPEEGEDEAALEKGRGLHGLDIAVSESKIDPMAPRISIFLAFLLLAAGPGLAGTPPATPAEKTPSPAKTPPPPSADRQALAEKNLRASEDFLAANGKRPGVFTTYKGLQYEILKAGQGRSPGPNDLVTVRFTWALTDGKKLPVLDSGTPVTVPTENLMEGFSAAVKLMSVGAKWRIWLPPALGFGEAGRGALVGPNTVLVVDCELFGIRPIGSPIPGQPPKKTATPPAKPPG
jgi:FKBP-type peptidyl-prolyl cis-trans isomerase